MGQQRTSRPCLLLSMSSPSSSLTPLGSAGFEPAQPMFYSIAGGAMQRYSIAAGTMQRGTSLSPICRRCIGTCTECLGGVPGAGAVGGNGARAGLREHSSKT